MELLIEVAASDVEEGTIPRKSLSALTLVVTRFLEVNGISPIIATVMAEREILEPGPLELSQIAGAYSIHEGIRPVARFYDEATARRVFAFLKGEPDGMA